MPNIVYTVEERVEMVVRHAQGLSYRRIADHFAAEYPGRPIPSKTTIQNIVKMFKDTGNADPTKNKLSYPSRQLTEETQMEIFLVIVEAEGKRSLFRIAQELQVSKASIYRTLRAHHYRAYKVQQHQELELNDNESRMIFCERMMDRLNADPGLLSRICFSDESTIELVGAPNRQNNRTWSDEPPTEVLETASQYQRKVNVWLGMVGDRLVGPLFIQGNLNGARYLEMLREEIVPAIREIEGDGPAIWFQQDGAPPHYTLAVRAYLNETFPERWIGRGGPVQWPPRSPDLTPLDYSLWAYLKNRIYTEGPMANVNVLRDRIARVLAEIDPEMIKNMIQAFYNRIGYCSAAEGGHFEQLLN